MILNTQDLITKLTNINKPKVACITEGKCETLEEIWSKLILPVMPRKEVVLRWHQVLMDYIRKPDAMYAIRGYNSENKKEKYDRLRRGFLTQTSEGYSFFYTDNYHAAYFLKMAMDGVVPTAEAMLSVYNSRKFPSRFGRDTRNEREMMAIKKGKDPGIQLAGYKIAHIYNVGKDYEEEGKSISLIKNIVDKYYPRGERSDWKMVSDKADSYFVRFLTVLPEAREYIVAAYLRFVHPFNYFLIPKKSLSSLDVSENPYLIAYVREKMREMYGTAYDEFLNLIKPVTNQSNQIISGEYKLEISYSPVALEKKTNTTSKSKSENPESKSGSTKALNRLEGVYAAHSIIHEIIQRAIDLGCTDARSVSMDALMVGQIKRSNLQSMKTESGNAYGRYFISTGRGANAQVCFAPEVWQKLLELNWAK